MIHSVKQLIFVHQMSDRKVGQTSKKNLPRAWQYTVHNTNYEDEECLWKVEAIAEYRRLNKFRIV